MLLEISVITMVNRNYTDNGNKVVDSMVDLDPVYMVEARKRHRD